MQHHAMQDQGGILSILLNETFLDENFMRQHAMHNSGRFLNLTISDTGCGMSHEVVERIFDPYFTTKEMGDGTGISDMTMPGSTSNGTFKFFNNRFGKSRRNRLSFFIPNHPYFAARQKPVLSCCRQIPAGNIQNEMSHCMFLIVSKPC
jgi:hypothetical protein